MSNPEKNIIVSALVVTYNSTAGVGSCLTALLDETARVGGEVIVFDNRSQDDTVPMIKREFPGVTLYESERNLGFGGANNRAAEKARGKYLLLANPDMLLDAGALKALVEAYESRPDAGAVVARLRNTNGTFQPTCRNFPDYYNIFFSRGSVLNQKGLPKPKNARPTYTLGDFGEITAIPAASAACLLIEREFFLEIGGFDPRFFLFMEDTDLSLRIKQAGRKIYFVPEANALHHWGRGSSISMIRRSWYHHMSVWRYYMKHFPNGFSLLVLPVALLANFVVRSLIGFDPR